MSGIIQISTNKIKEITKLHKKKYRDESGTFIAEGAKAVQELIDSGIEILEIYALEKHKFPNINVPINIINNSHMKKISTTVNECEILAVAKKRNYKIEEIKNLKKIALFDSISDPGNMGTIIRSAAAFGIDGIILYNDCVDLYSPKVIRSSAGNLFKTPIIQVKSLKELNDNFNYHTKIATALSKDNNISLKELYKIDKFIIMFGSEAKGLNQDLIKISEKNLKLKMRNEVESLNLAITASIIFYEISEI